MPTEIASDAPFFKVTIGHSRPLWFTIDTGSPYTFLDAATAKELGLRPEGEGSVTGAGAGEVKLQFLESVDFDLGVMRSRQHRVRVADLSGLPALFGHPIDGFFGYDLLEKTVVTMDPSAKEIVFTDPAHFRAPRHATALPIRFGGKHGRWIYVPGMVKVPGVPAATTEFLVDSGSTDALNHPLLRKSTGALRQINSGNGLGTPIPGVAGRVEWIKLGPYQLDDLPASCCGASPGTESLIGQGTLRFFVSTFDYSRKKMFIERLK